MGISKISTTGHWNDGGYLATCLVQFEIFPDSKIQDGLKSQVFRVKKQVLDRESQPSAIFRATALALSEMATKVGLYAGPLVDGGFLEHLDHDPTSTVTKIAFEEISIG